MSLEKLIQKLTQVISAAKTGSIQRLSQPSIVPGWRRLGDCPMRSIGAGQFAVDWEKVPVGACCFTTNVNGQCAQQCRTPGGLSKVSLVGDGPCPQNGLFSGDDAYTAATMDPSLMDGPGGSRPPKKPKTYGPIKITSNNEVMDCECVEVAGSSNMCVAARCPDGTFCRAMNYAWRCWAPFRLPEIQPTVAQYRTGQ
jgi:hypothetical protein